MIRRPPRSTLSSSSAASDVYKRQVRACFIPRTGTEQVANDGERAQATGGTRTGAALQSAQDNDFAASRTDERFGGSASDDGLLIAVDRDVAHDVVDLLFDVELNRAVGTDEWFYGQLDADVLGTDRSLVPTDHGTARARCGVVEVAADHGPLFADKNLTLAIMGSDDVGDRENVGVCLARRCRKRDLRLSLIHISEP